MDRFAGVYKKCKVIIVGAGVSGIAAAARLIASGFTGDDIVLLEASNRIGGRVDTKTFDGYTVDLGAQWVHGEGGNIVYEMAKKAGGNLLDDSASNFVNVQCVLSNRDVVDVDLTAKLYLMCEEIRDNIIEQKNNSGSYGNYLVPRCKEYIDIKMPDVSDEIKNGFLEWLHQFHNSIDGSDSWYQTSITTLKEYLECEGNSLIKWKEGGYANVINLICYNYGLEKSVVENQIILNKEVKQILWNKQYDSKQNRNHQLSNVLLTCADGSKFMAECVIITVSLGVLKQSYSSLFYPHLPSSKVNVIKGLGIGTVDKIFVKFPYRWWPSDCPGFSLLWLKDDLENTDFIQGDKWWIKDIFGFYIVDGAEKLLCGWVVGESAKIMEQQSDECILEVCYKLLNKFLGSQFNIPKPVAVLRSRWQSDPYIRGAYSFRSVDSDKLNVMHSQLAEPLINDFGKKVVFFAGEATHPHFYSTVHGAIETGYNQAEEVMSTLSQNARSKL